jgi:glycosyltransferase involved in cell wall biosynthesis
MATIAIICGAGMVSGKEIMALELGEGLRSINRPVVYATSKWGNGQFADQLRNRQFSFDCLRLGFISASLRLDCMRMSADQLIHWPKLLHDYGRFLRRNKPKFVVHTNWHHLLVLWPFLRADRDLFWVHDIIPRKRQYKYLFAALQEKLKSFVAVSNAVANSLLDVGIQNNNIEVIYNGFQDPTNGDLQDSVAHTGQDYIAIGVIGQIAPWKGHEDLLMAFREITSRNPNARLHIFGEMKGEFCKVLMQMSERLKIDNRVIWRGFVEDIGQIYRSLDVCIVPSRVAESFGLVAAEAAFFRRPVVATHLGGLTEIVVDGETGFLVEPQEPFVLANRIERLVRCDSLRRRMGYAARCRATEKFSRERLVADFERHLAASSAHS